MWAEVLAAFFAEAYREVMEWWQTRAFFRPREHPRGGIAAERAVEDEVEAILDRHARKHVGVAIGVRLGDETWTIARGDVRSDSIFEIGSVTKVFTATLLADMAEEGLVALEDSVQRYLPDGVELPVRGRPVTLADLATQSSGLGRLPPGFVRRSLRQRSNPYAGYTEGDLERAVTRARLRGSPGEKLRYSNFGFGLLGHVLARRANRSFEQLVHERICEPLGLRDTTISIASEAHARFADGHDRRGRPVPHWDLAALAGAGGLRSTVVDQLRFLELQLRPPATRLGRAARATHEPRMRRGKLAQCLGWVRLPLRRSPHGVLWHNGGTGGFRSFVGFVEEAQVGVVVLSNSARSVDAIGFRLLEELSARPRGGSATRTAR